MTKSEMWRDMRSAKLNPAASRHLGVETTIVDNPFFQREHAESQTNPSRITAAINTRESGIEYLYACKHINDAQKRAADRFRGLWEAMGGAGAGAIDYSREKVDGGKPPNPVSAPQVSAGMELARLKDFLGDYGYRLVGYIAGQGYSPRELCQTRRQREVLTAMLKAYLDQLAEFWGYKASRRTFHVMRVRMPDQARKDGLPEFIVQPSSVSPRDITDQIRAARKDWKEFAVAIIGVDQNMEIDEANQFALSLAQKHRATAMPFGKKEQIHNELVVWSE